MHMCIDNIYGERSTTRDINVQMSERRQRGLSLLSFVLLKKRMCGVNECMIVNPRCKFLFV